MELIVVTLTVCISFSVMLSPSASQQIGVHSSYDQGDLPVSILTLPRKLMLIEEAASTTTVKASGGKEHLSSYKQPIKGSFPGKLHQKESSMVMHARGSGTRQEWTERIDSSQFFTMDYSHVRRRRPIHNKSLPVAP